MDSSQLAGLTELGWILSGYFEGVFSAAGAARRRGPPLLAAVRSAIVKRGAA